MAYKNIYMAYKNKFLIGFMFCLLMIQACSSPPRVDRKDFEMAAVTFLRNEVLPNLSKHRPFQDYSYLIKSFTIDKLNSRKFFIRDSICHWSSSEAINGLLLNGELSLKPFSCYPLTKESPFDIDVISLDSFVSLKDSSSFLMEVKRPVLHDSISYITIELYSGVPSEQGKCFNFILEGEKISLESICEVDRWEYSIRGLID